MLEVLEMLEEIEDPRGLSKVHYNLTSVLFVSLCGVICGCRTWLDIADYCKYNLDFLSRLVDLRSGAIPSWTLRRVFMLIDPSKIELLLQKLAKEISRRGNLGDQICIDGKAMRGSKRVGKGTLHSVSAYCYENGLVLCEEQVDEKSNEITAIPKLLDSISIGGATVTLDAMHCQKSTTQLIYEKHAHYVIGLKKNQPTLYKQVMELIAKEGEHSGNRIRDYFDDSHGRCVRRRYFVYDIRSLDMAEYFCDAKTVVAVESIRSIDNDPKRKVVAEWRYYITSHKATNPKLPDYIRNHWSIENSLHWMLDVHFEEDADRKAERISVRNLSILRRLAVNLLRNHPDDPKKSMRSKMNRAKWDFKYLLDVLR